MNNTDEFYVDSYRIISVDNCTAVILILMRFLYTVLEEHPKRYFLPLQD